MTPDETAAMGAAESEIDHAFLGNSLCSESLATATWSLLSFLEDWEIRPIIQGQTEIPYHFVQRVDMSLNALKFPMDWLSRQCEQNGTLVRRHDSASYKAALDMMELGKRYYGFCGPFQAWSRGELGLTIDGNRIVPERSFESAVEYEAYNRLIDCPVDQEAPPGSEVLAADIAALVRVNGSRFTISVNPQLVQRVTSAVEPHFRARFFLPESWCFSCFSMKDFRIVYLALFTLAVIQRRARLVAAGRGCVGFGFDDAVIVILIEDLILRLVRYTGLPAHSVKSVLDFLTYGNSQSNPDPALQPLIKVAGAKYIISPFLFLHTSPERNLCTLLNRLPHERKIYSRLTREKETLMQNEIESVVADKGFRSVKGKIPGRDDVGDIDLAIISDREQACLVIELKWFIEPAEFREVIERREELAKGINQVEARIAAIQEGSSGCASLFGSVPSKLQGVVLSKNWIGDRFIQEKFWPVISEEHFLKKLKATDSLSSLMEWIQNRGFLPVLGQHFAVQRSQISIGRWTTEWYGIQPLIDEPFLNKQ